MKTTGQALAYLLFMAFIGALSVWPEYRLLRPAEAMISMTFSHAGQRLGECRQLSQQELEELPPNMRRPADCPRQRHPVFVRLVANDDVMFEDILPPSGFWEDGKSNLYRRFRIEAGHYSLKPGLNDSGGTATMDSEQQFDVSITPGENLVIGFDQESREFYLKQGAT